MSRHRFDVLSFAFGLAFALVGLVLLAGDTIRSRELLPLAGPLAAMILGVLLVLAARPQRDRSEETGEPELDEGAAAS